ncbi:hypothetical protein O0I10_012997 [Lichtheimia ornata]|uniref:Uncharacterized protein n=1 Tax=Lichtheimia ornata TaxID=688661 RepID=A0AAD7URP9_9FUNG|nr:uncharacterized protein O0I10_012997 [Lichtheimia ornata]KAJ8651449.1 hypothetical protein O0I10_012997 [Lichtheimia ornata]
MSSPNNNTPANNSANGNNSAHGNNLPGNNAATSTANNMPTTTGSVELTGARASNHRDDVSVIRESIASTKAKLTSLAVTQAQLLAQPTSQEVQQQLQDVTNQQKLLLDGLSVTKSILEELTGDTPSVTGSM